MTPPAPTGREVAPGPDRPRVGPLVAVLMSQFDTLESLAASLTAREWYAPAALPGWAVIDVYAHLIGTESVMEGCDPPRIGSAIIGLGHVRNRRGASNEAWIESLSDLAPEEVLDRYRCVVATRRRSLEALTEDDLVETAGGPDGPQPLEHLLRERLFDSWIHEQDVREGLGRPGNERSPAARSALDHALRCLPPALTGRIEASEGTTVVLDLTGPLPERVGLTAGPDGWRVAPSAPAGPTATLSLTSSLFLRLVAGRIDQLSPRLGAIDFAGDLDLATRVATNLTITE